MDAVERTALERWVTHRDPEAFRDIVLCHSGMVHATCWRVLGNAADAEDATQESFEALARTKAPPQGHLGPWLHRVATRIALNKRRGDVRRAQREKRFAAESQQETEVAWDDVYGLVDEAIAGLPDQLRMPLVAHFLENRSHAAIAEATGVPRRTVSHRIRQGIERIGKALRKRGVHIAPQALGGLLATHLILARPCSAAMLQNLGKLALAQAADSAVTQAALLGGSLLMKKLAIGAAALILLAVIVWPLTQSEPSDTPTDKAQESSSQADRTRVAETDFAPHAAAVGERQDAGQASGEGHSAVAPPPPGTREPGGASSEVAYGAESLSSASADDNEDADEQEGSGEYGELSGTILFDGYPAAEASVCVTQYTPSGDMFEEWVVTDEEGRYSLREQKPGSRSVHFTTLTPRGHKMRKVPVIIETGQVTEADVEFMALGTARIEGRVIDAAGTGLAADVEAHFLEDIYYTKTASDGSYSFEDLPAGPVTLTTFLTSEAAPIGSKRMTNLVLEEGQDVYQDILFGATSIACSVSNIPKTSVAAFVGALPGEVDIPEPSVEAIIEITRLRVASSPVAPDGTAVLTELAPGTYTILAVAFPSDPTAAVSLDDEGREAFAQGAYFAWTYVTIEQAGEALSVALSF